MTTSPVLEVRVRLLPWRPRWRSAKDDYTVPDVPLGDDPISGVLALFLLVLFLPVLAVVLFGVVVLALEVLLLLLLLPLLWAGQLLHLLPWRLVLTHDDGARTVEEVSGTRAMLRRRRALRAALARPS